MQLPWAPLTRGLLLHMNITKDAGEAESEKGEHGCIRNYENQLLYIQLKNSLLFLCLGNPAVQGLLVYSFEKVDFLTWLSYLLLRWSLEDVKLQPTSFMAAYLARSAALIFLPPFLPPLLSFQQQSRIRAAIPRRPTPGNEDTALFRSAKPRGHSVVRSWLRSHSLLLTAPVTGWILIL